MKLQRDLREFIELLNSLAIEYLVVGGHAVAFHGHPRYTGDIDFLIAPHLANARKLIVALERFGFGTLPVTAEHFLEPGQVVQLGAPPNRIDLLTSISGVEFAEAWEGRVPGTLDELPVAYLGLDELLKNKQAAGRAKDLADAQILAQRNRPR